MLLIADLKSFLITESERIIKNKKISKKIFIIEEL